MANTNRPLSPHLQVYRPQITSILSITHRITGVALTGGAVLFSYWIMAATYGPEAFARAQAVFGSWFGQLVLWGMVFSLFFHLGNGIRHLGWDIGWGYELDKLRTSGWLTVVFAVAMTVLTLVVAYAAAGG
ncbi:MAG: succinate dehydrogenase, cytochrome b556 subunit [Magnetovibrio sp.]|nr:succinate dehydrogenase, cytochrome b556 subunit [Magnetovibrio sp.]